MLVTEEDYKVEKIYKVAKSLFIIFSSIPKGRVYSMKL